MSFDSIRDFESKIQSATNKKVLAAETNSSPKGNIFKVCCGSVIFKSVVSILLQIIAKYNPLKKIFKRFCFVGSVVEWLKHCDCDQHCFGSEPTRAILSCFWERHLTALRPALWVLESSSKF